jgi:hypothetical protein
MLMKGSPISMRNIRDVWDSKSSEVWERGLEDYWRYVKPHLLSIEREMQHLDRERVRVMNAQQWYIFLLEKYFRWKYTAPNRYTTTTNSFRMYESEPFLSILHGIKEQMFKVDKADIKQCLAIANRISGLGPAGASGLLAVLFPQHFGTADQFAVKALVHISDLPENARVAAIKNPESLKIAESVLLVQIMRHKAASLNALFSTNSWTPRKVDMILWAYGHGC